jgi:Cu/Ag efflux protein CusF
LNCKLNGKVSGMRSTPFTLIAGLFLALTVSGDRIRFVADRQDGVLTVTALQPGR